MVWVVTPYDWDGKPGRQQRYSSPMSGKSPRELADDAARRIIAQRKVWWVNVSSERNEMRGGNGRYR